MRNIIIYILMVGIVVAALVTVALPSINSSGAQVKNKVQTMYQTNLAN